MWKVNNIKNEFKEMMCEDVGRIHLVGSYDGNGPSGSINVVIRILSR